MAMLDPEKERRRLVEHYSREFDGRLEQVAAQAYELSEIARQALEEELAKRGLSTILAQGPSVPHSQAAKQGKPPASVSPKPREFRAADADGIPVDSMVTLRQFRDLPEALLAKGSLVSSGIRCALADDNLVRLDWFYSNAIGGIKLLVHSEDAAEAEQILDQPIPEHFDVTDVGEYEQPRCPSCDSLDITFRELDPATYLTLGASWLGACVPVPIHRRAWHCRACDVEWEDDDVAGPPDSTA